VEELPKEVFCSFLYKDVNSWIKERKEINPQKLFETQKDGAESSAEAFWEFFGSNFRALNEYISPDRGRMYPSLQRT
jgi:hypothetical protein